MTLGILGGCGPAATAHFYARLVALTRGAGDRDHVDVLLSGRASTPDRTAYILGESDEAPVPVLVADARRLVAAGADLLVLLCHTAHAFLPELRAALSRPLLDMPSLALRHAAARGLTRVGVLATPGSYAAGVFDRPALREGISLLYPRGEEQEALAAAIYHGIKGESGGACVVTEEIAARLTGRGAELILLGCTELSLVFSTAGRMPSAACFWRPGSGGELLYLDPLELLARRAITLCGKEVKEESAHAASGFIISSARREAPAPAL